MIAFKLPNGNLLIPKRAEDEEGLGIVGDGMVEVEPGDPEYDLWLPYAQVSPKLPERISG